MKFRTKAFKKPIRIDKLSLKIEVRGHPRYVKTRDGLKNEGLNNKDLEAEIDAALDEFKDDVSKGDFDTNEPYPDRYKKDGVNNLYIYNIRSYRLIYTIRRNRYVKTYEVLDFLNHVEYNKIFHYFRGR